MSRQIQIRRGTSVEHNNFTGAVGEITMDTTNKTLRVHDGSTVGGNEMMSVNKFYSHASNCIVKIPQDINLVLSSGTLTLKSASKVYQPNGSGKFDIKNISADVSLSSGGSDNSNYFVFYEGTSLVLRPVSDCYSGTTAPTVSSQDSTWYDTTNNLIKDTNDTGTTWSNNGKSLPVAIVTCSSGTISKIVQIFNGFGYIGATVFAVPGVCGLAPNGHNADGSLKSNVILTNSVVTRTFALNATVYVGLQSSNFGAIATNSYVYNRTENMQYSSGTAFSNSVIFGKFTMSSGVISDWSQTSVCHLQDCNDTEFIANQAMPGNKYTNLTLGSDNTAYTAPADGYFTISKTSTAAGQRVGFTVNNGISVLNYAAASGEVLAAFIPVQKGQQVYARYTTDGTTNAFRFVYAKGSK